MAIKSFQEFTGGLNLSQSTNIGDNELTIAKNVFYNNSMQLQTRRGYRTFGNGIGPSPISSYFFYQRDDTLERIAVCNSGTKFYSYDGSLRNAVQSNLTANETRAGSTGNVTRWDYAVYKNTIYMGDGVNPYASYDGTTYAQIGVGAAVTCTFINATNYVNKSTHSLSEGDELFFVGNVGTLPAELNEYQVYYVLAVDADNFQVSTEKGGTAVTFTDDGTGTVEYNTLSEPRCRYIQYLGDRIIGAGDDANPSSLYYTGATPADGTNINANVVVVGGDEAGVINAINEYAQIAIVFKNEKSYSVNLAGSSIDAIDSQTGGYADRAVHNVGNSLAYFNERGVDTLVKRTGVDGAGAIESKPLSDKVRALMEEIEECQYNTSVGWYIKKLNNYYFSFDTTNDNKPDTTLVYNSMTKSWTEYTLPALYDYGYYIDYDKTYQYLFASANGGQMYQYEYGFTDDGEPIEVEVQTKNWDFDDPAQLKVFKFVDITGYKQEGGTLDVTVYVDGIASAFGEVTDSNLDFGSPSGALGQDPMGNEPIGSAGRDGDTELPIYPFTVRLPFYERGANVAVNWSSTGVQWIVEKVRVNVDGEVVPIFSFNDIL